MNEGALQESPLAIIKSILVVPVVASLVFGLGWGLVHLAERRERRSEKPAARPVQSGGDGVQVLQTPFAHIEGEVGYRGGRRPALSNWRHMGDAATWHFRSDRGGRFAVEIEYACAAPDAGSTIGVTVDGQSLQVAVPGTGGWKDFKTLRVGEVELRAEGWYDLRIAPLTIAHDAALILGGVRLVPINA